MQISEYFDFLLKENHTETQSIKTPKKCSPVSFCIFLISGIILFFLLSPIANAYGNYLLLNFGEAYTDCYVYLTSYPLVFLTILCIVLIAVGTILLIKFILNKKQPH